VNRIKGKTVIPIHTARPDLFASLAETGRTLPPRKGVKIQFG
jgi:hypothetical protein